VHDTKGESLTASIGESKGDAEALASLRRARCRIVLDFAELAPDALS
jgi:hypothetical protein